MSRYSNILLGFDIRVYTCYKDNKNIFRSYKLQHIVCFRMDPIYKSLGHLTYMGEWG